MPHSNTTQLATSQQCWEDPTTVYETNGCSYPNIAAAVFGAVWAIVPAKLEAIIDVVKTRTAGLTIDAETVAAIQSKRVVASPRVTGNISVLPLVGSLAQRVSLLAAGSGGMSTQQFGAEFDKAMDDETVGAIVIDVDSPGGAVYGTPELTDKIYKARGRKPIVAVVDSLMASAAYWIGSAADEIVITPGGEMGSIGILAIHTDISEAETAMGVKTTLIHAGQYKVEGNPHEPLNDTARSAIQKRVDEYYSMFVADLARNRNVSKATVRNKYGQGRIVGAEEAVDAGMADRIGTIEQVIADLRPTRPSRKAASHNKVTLAKARQAPTR